MRRLLPLLIAVVALVLLVRTGSGIVQREILAPRADQAADALPVYLAAGTFARGGDPTDRGALKETYDARGLTARAATFSTLYPVTLAALLRPVAGVSWDRFILGWRWMLLVSAAGLGVAAASARPLRRPARPWVPVLGALLVLAFPTTGECVRLGQVNMALGLLVALALLAMGRGRDRWAGVLAAVGAAVKLVPAAIFLPLAAGRRWRALAVGGLVYGAIFGFAALAVGPAAIVEGIRESLSFQDAIGPDWANPHALPVDAQGQPLRWVAFLAILRHRPLLWLTVVVGGGLAFLKPRPAVLVGTGALLSAWLGTSASAFHVLYTPLFLPALVYVAAWPFEEEAPVALAAPVAALAVGGPLLLHGLDSVVVVEARMVMAGLLVWGLALVRLVQAWRAEPAPASPWLRWAGVLVPPVAGVVVGVVVLRNLPGRGPMGPPIPPLEQNPDAAGFIRPEDPVPGARDPGVRPGERAAPADLGAPRFAGQWPAVPAGGTLRPGTQGLLAAHLDGAEARWQAVGDAWPVHRDLVAWVLAVRPTGPVAGLSAGEVIRFLVREEVALEQVGADRAPDLRHELDRVLGREPGERRGRRR